MRRLKTLATLIVAFVLASAITGCGCQSTSGSSGGHDNGQSNNSAKQTSEEHVTEVNNSNTNFEPTKTLSERKGVNYEDYISNGEFNLTEYAKALGYTRLKEPGDDGVVMYAIQRDNAIYFFVYTSNLTYVFVDKKDGFVYETSPEGGQTNPKDFAILSEGQNTQFTSKRGLEYIITPLQHIATADSVSIDYLPGFAKIDKYEGPAQYYDNGAIKYDKLTTEIDSLECHGLNF